MLHPRHLLHLGRMGLHIGNGPDHHFMRDFPRILDKETNCLASADLDVTRRKPHGIVHRQFNRARNFSRIARLTSWRRRSEEHTSELQSLMRISYAVFCLKKKTYTNYT